MKGVLDHIHPVFENRVRLAVMSMLMVNESVEFTAFRQTLEITDGNLASHLAMLEKNGFISVKKQFIGRKPLTTYSATRAGKHHFQQHLTALEQLIRRAL